LRSAKLPSGSSPRSSSRVGFRTRRNQRSLRAADVEVVRERVTDFRFDRLAFRVEIGVTAVLRSGLVQPGVQRVEPLQLARGARQGIEREVQRVR
jgi:hypothetical protein